MGSLGITLGTALAGLALAGATAFGITKTATQTPAPVNEPVVLYGQR